MGLVPWYWWRANRTTTTREYICVSSDVLVIPSGALQQVKMKAIREIPPGSPKIIVKPIAQLRCVTNDEGRSQTFSALVEPKNGFDNHSDPFRRHEEFEIADLWSKCWEIETSAFSPSPKGWKLERRR